MVYDWDRGAISEILLMSGAELPATGQLVMLDAHSRYETSDIIGSVRDIRIEGGALVGRAYFSAAPEAEGPWIKTKEGHLTDFSIGYRVDDKNAVWIPEGQTALVEGKSYAGPVRVTTKWIPRELSAVPIGADQNAKARSDHAHNLNKEDYTMDKKTREMLERKGLPVTATEEEAWAFMDTLGARTEPDDAGKAKKEQDDKALKDQEMGAVSALAGAQSHSAMLQQQQAAQQQGGAGAPPPGMPMGGAPRGGLPAGGGANAGTLSGMASQAEQIAGQLAGMPEWDRKQQLKALREGNKDLHGLVKSKLDEIRQQASSQGQQMLLQGGQGGQPPGGGGAPQ
jgi:hypothetical protein